MLFNVLPVERAVEHARCAWDGMSADAQRRVWEHERRMADRPQPWGAGTDRCTRCDDFTAYCDPSCPTIQRRQRDENDRCTPNP